MRIFGVIAAFCVATATPAAADVIAACGNLASQQADRFQGNGGFRATRWLLSKHAEPTPRTPIALWRDAAGFDVLLNWGEHNQLSLRAEGADIAGMEAGADSVHLIVMRNETQSLEHFLFSFPDSHPGQLVWSAAKDATDESSGVLTLESVCMKVK